MTLAIKRAIETGDTTSLAGHLKANPGSADEFISWGEDGKNQTTPLHFVSDMVFNECITQEQGLTLIETLLGGGANIDKPGNKHGDSPLIAAASLGAEDIALRLLSAGADMAVRGLFDATALHWASLLGEDRLVKALLHMKADALLKDSANNGTPLDWAVYGWNKDIPGKADRQPEVAELLVAVGCPVSGTMLEDLTTDRDAPMRAALEPDIVEDDDAAGNTSGAA